MISVAGLRNGVALRGLIVVVLVIMLTVAAVYAQEITGPSYHSTGFGLAAYANR